MNKYFKTLKYGDVLIRYNRTYANNLIDCIEDCEGNIYDIYTDFKGRLVAIKYDEE